LLYTHGKQRHTRAESSQRKRRISKSVTHESTIASAQESTKSTSKSLYNVLGEEEELPLDAVGFLGQTAGFDTICSHEEESKHSEEALKQQEDDKAEGRGTIYGAPTSDVQLATRQRWLPASWLRAHSVVLR
jgi:hypothetical protein